MPKGVYDHHGKKNGTRQRSGPRTYRSGGSQYVPRGGHGGTTRKLRKWITKDAVGLRPVADPKAICVVCQQPGSDWYGAHGDAVHVKCWRKAFVETKAVDD